MDEVYLARSDSRPIGRQIRDTDQVMGVGRNHRIEAIVEDMGHDQVTARTCPGYAKAHLQRRRIRDSAT